MSNQLKQVNVNLKKKKNKTKKKGLNKKTFCKKSTLFNKERKTISYKYKILKPLVGYASDHSIIYDPNKIPDTCTDIKIWKYEVIRDGKLIKSKDPITTNPKYKKNKGLPFLISCSLFGSKPKYIDGVFKMLKSLELHGLTDKWDVRLYIASRKDGKNVNLSTSKEIQKNLLSKGIELAHVDNGNPNGYSLEGTFWRICALSEKARVLIRDVDYIFTAHDLIAIAEWIKSKLIWHRIFHYQLTISPFILGCIGAIGGPNLIKNLHNKIKNYQHKKKYGDDELFAANYLFMEALKKDSICTHYYPFKLIIKPTNESSFFPTNKYIEKIIGIPVKEQKSIDIKLPDKYGNQSYGWDLLKIVFDQKHINEKKKYLSLKFYGDRGETCKKILKIDKNEFHS